MSALSWGTTIPRPGFFKDVFDIFMIHQEEIISVIYAVLEGRGQGSPPGLETYPGM